MKVLGILSRSVFLVIFFLIPGGSVLAANADDVVRRVDNAYAKIQDLQGEFTQETIIEGFETGFQSTGRFYLKKPGLLKWDYLQPSKEHIYVDGDGVMMYVPEHQQVVQGTLTQISASKGPLALLLGVGKLAEQFTVLEASGVSEEKAEFPTVMLVPKPDGETAPTIEKIMLQVFPDSYLIQVMTIFDTNANISRVRFDHLQMNQGLDASLLKFTLPPDVVVVDFPSF